MNVILIRLLLLDTNLAFYFIYEKSESTIFLYENALERWSTVPHGEKFMELKEKKKSKKIC